MLLTTKKASLYSVSAGLLHAINLYRDVLAPSHTASRAVAFGPSCCCPRLAEALNERNQPNPISAVSLFAIIQLGWVLGSKNN